MLKISENNGTEEFVLATLSARRLVGSRRTSKSGYEVPTSMINSNWLNFMSSKFDKHRCWQHPGGNIYPTFSPYRDQTTMEQIRLRIWRRLLVSGHDYCQTSYRQWFSVDHWNWKFFILFVIYSYKVNHSAGTVPPWGPVRHKSILVKENHCVKHNEKYKIKPLVPDHKLCRSHKLKPWQRQHW